MTGQSFWEKEPSFLVHRRDYKEHSLLLDFFCLNLGRISAVCHLPRKSAARMQAALQPYQPLSLNLKASRSSDLMILSGVEWVQSEQGQRLEVPQLFCAQYLNELIFHLIKGGTPEPGLFVSYLETLRQLAQGGQSELALRSFEMVLLSTLGYALPYQELCRAPDFAPGARYKFSLEQGFYVAADPQDQRAYSGEVLQALFLKNYQHPQALSALKRLHGQIFYQLLGGRELQSRKLYRAYLALN